MESMFILRFSFFTVAMIGLVYICLNIFPAFVHNNEDDLQEKTYESIDYANPRPHPPPIRKLSNIRARRKPMHVRMYRDTHPETDNSDFDCVSSTTEPSFQICIYEIQKDKYISGALRTSGVWEPYITQVFQSALIKYPEALVLDIGANVGYYSLLGARMGHQAIAVEPSSQNIQRLQKAIHINHLAHKVLIAYTALYDKHENVTLTHNKDNQGGIWIKPVSSLDSLQPPLKQPVIPTILMDDLLEVTEFTQAILKVDIEGFECKALARSEKLLSSVYVPYIFMEWKKMFMNQHAPMSPCPTEAMKQLTQYFVKKGYIPHEVRTGFQLNPIRSTTWWKIGDLYWRHGTAKQLQDPY